MKLETVVTMVPVIEDAEVGRLCKPQEFKASRVGVGAAFAVDYIGFNSQHSTYHRHSRRFTAHLIWGIKMNLAT